MSDPSALNLIRRGDAWTARRPRHLGAMTAGSGVGGDQGMVTTEQQAPGRATVAQRWLARLALGAAAAAVLVPLAAIGFRASVALVLVGMAGLGLTAAGIWWALTHKGLVRWLAICRGRPGAAGGADPLHEQGLLWVVLVALGLLVGGRGRRPGGAGRGRTREDARVRRPAAQPALPDHEPALGRREGGRFGLKDKAEALGATVALLEGPGTVDVGELARQAVANGADLLGVAGGDGTQALVAAVAAEHDVPLLVISAGTRNHFALDLGLDREDPSRCLDALTDGVELRIDLGFIAGRPFVNNASFGACRRGAEPGLPRRQAPHDDRDAPRSARRPERAAAGGQGRERDRRGAPGGPGIQQPVWDGRHRRARAPGPAGPRHPGDVRRHRPKRRPGGRPVAREPLEGLISLAGREVVIDADAAQIPVGVDGEALVLDTPVRCTSGRPPCGSGCPVTVPGCRIPSPSWTGNASGGWP